MGDSRVRVFDRERALLDCFALPRRFGGVAEGLAIVEEHVRELDIGRLVNHARQYATVAVAKRVGYALEGAGAKPKLVEPLRSLPMLGYRPLDPTRAPRGVRNRRWGLVENVAATKKRAVDRRLRGLADDDTTSPGTAPPGAVLVGPDRIAPAPAAELAAAAQAFHDENRLASQSG